jgi:hypothetical protein
MPRTNVVGTTTPPGQWRPKMCSGGREHRIDNTAGTAATAARSSPLLSAYDGQRCIGFVCSRGKLGFEAFDSEERSLGVYGTQREAAAAIMRGSP